MRRAFGWPALAVAPVAAAASGGALYVLAFLGYGGWPLLGVFLVPLWWALERVRERGPLASTAIGFVFGAVAYGAGHPWLLRLVDVFLEGDALLGGVLWGLYGIGFAAALGLYGLLFRALRSSGRGVALAGIAPWIAIEWLQPWPFPVHAGAALVGVPALVQIADLGGTLLLSAVVGIANWTVYETIRWLLRRRGAPATVWGIAATVFAAASLYGGLRTARIEADLAEGSALRVGLVQANLGPLEKRRRERLGHRRHLERTRALLAGGPLDLVVWPETAYGRALQGPLPVSGRLVRGDLEVPLLFGGTLLDRSGPSPRQWNSALLVGRDGLIRDAYRKNLLIPIAESIPFGRVWPALEAALPHAQDFGASDDANALVLDDFRIAVPICYEAIRPAFVRRLVNESGANLLVTLANDAWFGASREPRIHFELARMRAVEHRLYLVRATNSGISAIIDPLGRVVARTGVLESAELRGVVHRMSGRTLYDRLGDWPGPLAALATAIGLWPWRDPRHRAEEGGAPADAANGAVRVAAGRSGE
jgi:apolipoprotein N-acyltransferase